MTNNDLDKILEMKMTNLKPTDLDDDDDESESESDDDVSPEEANIKLKELTKELKKVLQQSSEYDGVNLNEDFEEDDNENIPLPPSDIETEMDRELESISDHSDIYSDSNAKDMNMIENLLKSMEAQDGMSGPASNLLSMLYENVEKKNKPYKNKK